MNISAGVFFYATNTNRSIDLECFAPLQNLGEVFIIQKQLNDDNDKLNKLSDELNKAYIENQKKSHGYDGLLKRIQISHEISHIWIVILLVFLCIETGPIFFKMMMTKGVYDFLVENYNKRREVENGIFREDFIITIFFRIFMF